jgi:hypothetical protein
VGAASAISGVFEQLRGHPGHASRLAGARAAGDHLEPPGRPHLVEVGGNRALLAPVPVEVEPGAEQSQRPRFAGAHAVLAVLADRDQLTPRERVEPLVDSRPRQLRQIDRLVGFDGRGLANRRQVDEHVSQPRSAHGQRDRESHRVALHPNQPGQPRRDVYVRRRQQPDLVERTQQPRCADRPARFERICDRAHAEPPRSSTSLSATTSGPGGRQANTPASASPAMPRRNRYRTPAKCRPGE